MWQLTLLSVGITRGLDCTGCDRYYLIVHGRVGDPTRVIKLESNLSLLGMNSLSD